MGDRTFKYRRSDFGELPVALHHLTIYVSFFEDRVEAANRLDMTARFGLDTLDLDAQDLDIIGVAWCAGPDDADATPLAYRYDKGRNRLSVTLPRHVAKGERFFVRTQTICYPSDHILEGIYRDVTPPGAPQQYMSQCQQWGFQRIMPILDDCRAKCTFVTTLEGDCRYTHLISNGNISPIANPGGKPTPKPGNPERQVITFENNIPMAPYLFISCAGTWDVLADKITYPSGRTVRLEYLVPPGATENVRIPMDILREAVLWIETTQDYEYQADTYRTICMTKSNFGGMENVGNTTIVTDAALITPHTQDLSLLYAHAVIVHEFEHNQCGSETTMDTPFDVWLNEAYTVDVERQFMADMFDPSFMRLQQVDSIRNPLLGPLAIEDAGHVGRIVRDGFNNPDELIDSVTYVKAAEVIRMLRLVLGPDKFREGKTLYFSRYRNANADTDQFFACFEEVAGVSLTQFKKRWLYTIGYPKVTATTAYEAASGTYRIRFMQHGGEGAGPFHLPIELALVNSEGKDIPGTHRVFQLTEAMQDIVFEHMRETPAFASMNRDYSFYGTFFDQSATPETLALQARLDTNAYSRIDAFRQLTDRERVKLLLDPSAEIGLEWADLYGAFVLDSSLPPSLKAYFLRIDEQPLDRRYCSWHQELVRAREALMRAVNRRYRDALLDQFRSLDTYSPLAARTAGEGIQERMLKQVLLDLIVIDDSDESHRLILDHYRAATTATDRVSALTALNRSSAPFRHAILDEAYAAWHAHLTGYANYLRVVSSGTQPDVFDMIGTEAQRATFDITQPTWCRALFLTMASNNKVLWTDRGIPWLADTVIRLSPINTTTASRLLNAFQHVKTLKPDLQGKVVAALEHVAREVPESISPTIAGQARAYLGTHP
jgi:aminopeptidase N